MFNYMRQGKDFYRDVFRLALPLILQNIIMASLSMVDTFLVGTLGEASMAGITVARTPLFVVDLLIFGLQSGSAVLISQYWGKKDGQSINRIMGIGFYSAGALSAVFAFITIVFPMQAMSLFCNDAALVEIAASYIKYMGIAYIFQSITAIYTAANRGMENPKLGLILFGGGMCVDTFFSWVLIFGKFGAPALGVEGGAIGSLIGCVVSFVAMLIHGIVNKRFKLIPKLIINPGAAMLKKYIKYASPVVVNESLWGLGASLYPTIMGHMKNSQEILASYTLAGNVVDICMIAVFAVAATSSIIIGREIGSGNKDKVYSMGAALSILSVGVGLAMGAVMLVLLQTVVVPHVYPMFKFSILSAGTATTMMTIHALTLALIAFNCTNIIGVLRGGGDVRAATLIDVLPLWCIAIPLAALFGLVLEMGILWVCLARATDTLVKVSFGVKRFRSKKWINDVTEAPV